MRSGGKENIEIRAAGDKQASSKHRGNFNSSNRPLQRFGKQKTATPTFQHHKCYTHGSKISVQNPEYQNLIASLLKHLGAHSSRATLVLP